MPWMNFRPDRHWQRKCRNLRYVSWRNQWGKAAHVKGGSDMGLIISLGVVALVLAGVWRTFEKAGEPGWACLVPIYHLIVLCHIAGKPGWWFILFFVPGVNIIIAFIVCIEVAKRFGKGVEFGICLVFLGFIFFPILGFGNAQYSGRVERR
jgi:hypothetical protein